MFASITNEFFRLGGHEVNLTGGEPTMFSGLPRLVDSIHRPKQAILSLTTNGCIIQPLMGIQHKVALSVLNVSLHGWDQEFLSKTISPSYNRRQVCDNIQDLARYFKVRINFTLMRDNYDQFHNVAEFAIATKVDLKVINFQETTWNKRLPREQFVDPNCLIRVLTALADHVGSPGQASTLTEAYGAFLRRHTIGQTTVTIIDGSAGHRTIRVCNNCRFGDICKEGFYALRLYADGTFAPCLHRADLAIGYDVGCSLAENIELLLGAVL